MLPLSAHSIRASERTPHPALAEVELSVVIPVCNEQENVRPLGLEVAAALANGAPYEIVYVDDGSTDDTAASVRALHAELPQVRLIRHAVRCGQSAAIRTGVLAARAAWIVTLDGDGQNDPNDIPAFLAALRSDQSGTLKMVVGNRVSRQDTWLRRVSSRVANRVRARLLSDGTPDTGCGIKLFHRQTFLRVPAFKHMHRFLPALFQREGAQVLSLPVHHRPRTHGISKYGLRNRLWVGIVDLFGVRWLIARSQRTQAREDELP
jgi:dolichol-phosphate mannosyltransferase